MVWGLTPHKIHSLVGCSSEMGIFRQLTTTEKKGTSSETVCILVDTLPQAHPKSRLRR